MAELTIEPTEPRPKPLYRFVTTVPHQWFALIVKGEDLHKVIHGVRGWYVDENFEFQKEENERHRQVRTFLRTLTGREWVGLPPIHGIYRYKFAWNKYWRKEDKGGRAIPEYGIQAHEPEYVHFTPFEAQYPLMFGGIEVIAKQSGQEKSEKERERTSPDEALIPVSFVITVRVRMRRPEVALMTNVDWFGGVLTPNMQAAVKSFAGDKNYDELIRGNKGEVSRQFRNYIIGSNSETECEFRDNILEDAGVEVTDVDITEIKPHEAFEKALLDLAQAQRDAQAVIARAEADKTKKILDGEGEAAKIKAIAEAEKARIEQTTLLAAGGPGNNATQLEIWREIHGSGLSTLVQGGAGTGILIGAEGKPVTKTP